jgi:hypothetical protein
LVITLVSVGVIIGTGLVVGTAGPRAVGPHDQSPPVLEVPIDPSFVVGNILQRFPSCDGVEYTRNIGQSITWAATDNLGVTSYDLVALLGGQPATLLLFSHETQYTDYDFGSDDNGDCGGGSFSLEGFAVTARDHNGNAVTKVVSSGDPNGCCLLKVTQEDGTSATGPAGTFDYKGSWTTTTCDCLSGKAMSTTELGGRVLFTRTYDRGDHVALVMTQGPSHGVAAVRVDNKLVATVDTYAPVETNRVIVFEQVMSAGTHTVMVVNRATPGRPMIDLDAAITN